MHHILLNELIDIIAPVDCCWSSYLHWRINIHIKSSELID